MHNGVSVFDISDRSITAIYYNNLTNLQAQIIFKVKT